MKPERIINIHGHLHHSDDLPARVRLWEQWHIEKFCCQCMPRHLDKDAMGNEAFLKVRAQYKDLFVGFAGVNLSTDGIDTAADIRRYKEQGFAGLKFLDACHPYNHDAYFPIYETAQELGLPILLHTGYFGGSGESHKLHRTDSENYSPYKFDRIARSFPKLKLIGAHLGHPQMNVALYLTEFYPNLYWDFTGGGGQKVHVRMMLSALLPHPGLETDMANPQENRALFWFEHICFGTDNPEPDRWVPASEHILDRLQIPEAARKKFYYETAAKILGL